MGTMKFEVPHSLPRDEAKKRLEQLLSQWGTKYGVVSNWNGDGASVSGKVMGIQLDASFQISDSGVKGEGTDPGLLLRHQAKQYIQRKFSAVLDPGRSSADLKELD